MRTFGNVIWHFPFLGFVSAILVWFFGFLLTITIVAAPLGLGYMELGKFLFWPFGNTMVSKSDLNIKQNVPWKTYGFIVRVLFIPFGLCFMVLGVIQTAGLFLSIIGIPVGLVIAKSLGTYWNPVDKKCVPTSIAVELQKRKDDKAIKKYLG